jgi:hypothetical protein
MDYRNILATGFLLLCGAVFVYSLKSANAFPQGANVSMGSNPLFSFGGTVSNNTTTLFTAPSDQIMVVTDILLSMTQDSCKSTVSFTTTSGLTLGTINLHSKQIDTGGSYNRAALTGPTQTQHAFNSGLPLSIGDTLEIIESGNCGVGYTVSGYYAQP